MQQPPNPEDINHHYAGVFLVTETRELIGQLRDDKPDIDNPGKVTTFGGTVEKDEAPLDAAWRELILEETNLKLEKDAIQHLFDTVAWRERTSEWEVQHFFYATITDDELHNLEVYEGQGWKVIRGSEDPQLVDVWRPAVSKMLEVLKAD